MEKTVRKTSVSEKRELMKLIILIGVFVGVFGLLLQLAGTTDAILITLLGSVITISGPVFIYVLEELNL